MRRLLSFLAKAAISAVLLYLSLRRVNLDSVQARLGGLDFRWLAFILFVLCAQLSLNALRWRIIVAACGAKMRLATAVRYTFIGQFFGQVLPSTVGGDAARIWLLARGGAGWLTAIYSVLIDRVVGVFVLSAMIVTFLPWTLSLIHDPILRMALAIISIGTWACALIFFGLAQQTLRETLERRWITRHIAAASRLVWRLWQTDAGLGVGCLSIVIHLMTVIVAWGAAMAAHAAVDFIQVFFIILPVVLIATIPVSIAGWGVRESAMIFAFSYAGLAETDGLIVSILYGAVSLAVGAIGGIVWAASGYRWRSVKAIEADTLAHDRSD